MPIGTTDPGQSCPGSNNIEGLLLISKTAELKPLHEMVWVIFGKDFYGVDSYYYANMQLVYSSAPPD